MKLKILFFFYLIIFSIKAEIALPDFFSDNMVLQQNTTIKLWGTAKPKTNVYIKASWLNKTLECFSEIDGEWEISLKTTEASFKKQFIHISDGSELKIQNILIGEVWFCSGQSNMEMNFQGFKNEPLAEASYYINQASEESGIRMLNVKKTVKLEKNSKGRGKWQVSSVKNIPAFSAAAYIFAISLQRKINVPVGIINSSFGGSCIEGWLSPYYVEKYSDFDYKAGISDSMSWRRPYVMFENMLKPYHQYVIKGFIWYQGESNVNRYSSYSQKLQDLVYLWRETFNNSTLPFYVVEIAPYKYSEENKAAKLREAQFKAVKALKKSGFICTNDLVLNSESTNIHPSQKKEIGQRLANLVLFNDYHVDSLQSFSPSIENSFFFKDSIILTFENCYDGLISNDNFEGFEVADSSMIFIKTNAFLAADKKSITILNKDKNFIPVSVRYCFKDFQIGNVKNSVGLPLIPFRTDNWDN